MSEVITAQRSRGFSATGVWGALAGLILSLLAWYRQDFPLTGTDISLYVAVPAALLAATIFIPRIRSIPALLIHSFAILGLAAFCYGMFLLLLYQYVV